MIFLYAIGYPLALIGHYAHWFDLYPWLAFIPAAVSKGEVWRCVTYAFLPNGIVDWVVSIFWLSTLVSVLGRNWSGLMLAGYCLLTTVAGALFFMAINPQPGDGVVGCMAMIFGLLAAWDRLYQRERLILLGIGEISVRQAAILVASIWVLIFAFCFGGRLILAMLGGGAVGWLCLVLRGKTALNRRSQMIDSQRIARLEL